MADRSHLTSLRFASALTAACLKEPYGRDRLLRDVLAGLSVGIIAIPLSMALAVAMPDAQAMASSPKPWQRPWPWERRSWHQAPGKVPRLQAMAIASGHGSRPWPWLGPQAYGQRNVSMGIGYRVWGVGYWVVDIGYRVLGIFILSNTLDARWVGGF